jgi:hypothetical protein
MAERVAESKEVLVSSDNPDFDRFIKGMIRAYKEVLEFEIEFATEEELDDSEV